MHALLTANAGTNGSGNGAQAPLAPARAIELITGIVGSLSGYRDHLMSFVTTYDGSTLVGGAQRKRRRAPEVTADPMETLARKRRVLDDIDEIVTGLTRLIGGLGEMQIVLADTAADQDARKVMLSGRFMHPLAALSAFTQPGFDLMRRSCDEDAVRGSEADHANVAKCAYLFRRHRLARLRVKIYEIFGLKGTGVVSMQVMEIGTLGDLLDSGSLRDLLGSLLDIGGLGDGSVPDGRFGSRRDRTFGGERDDDRFHEGSGYHAHGGRRW